MADETEWTEVWKTLTDERLEETLYRYVWLSVNTPNSHASRIDTLVQECPVAAAVTFASGFKPGANKLVEEQPEIGFGTPVVKAR